MIALSDENPGEEPQMETEFKFAAPEEIVEEIWQDDEIISRMTEFIRHYEMHTSYYDTEDRQIREKRWTLRIRKENDVSVACCTTGGIRSGGLSSHEEWEVEADTIEQALPLLAAAGAPEELAAMDPALLQCTCTASFQRESAILELEDGCLAELSMDFGILSGPTESEPLCEIELELKAGPFAPMERWAEELAERYGLTPEPRSKLARAIALQ